MKRSICTVAAFAGIVSIALVQMSRGQVLGPGEKGATLRLPGAAPANPVAPSSIGKLWNNAPFSSTAAAPSAPRIAVPPSNDVDINKDIEITERQGPWVIYAMSYSGPDAPKMARDFALEMRNHPQLKLNAYVFNYGADEKRAENQRVEKVRKEQMEALEKAGIGDGKTVIGIPMRVRTMKIDEHTGVLIDGGFKTREDALAALNRLRKIKLKDEEAFAQRVKLDMKVAILEQADRSARSGVKVGEAELVVVNPFSRAFPARNPRMKQDEASQMDPKDIELIRELNKSEEFTILKLNKPYTLAIRQYNTQQVVIRNKKEQEDFLKRFKDASTFRKANAGGPDWSDFAANSAHNLCEAFRKSGLPETYVLHSKYASFVTVGAYDGVRDPRLQQMQDFLESRFRMEAYRPYELFPTPQVMVVPR